MFKFKKILAVSLLALCFQGSVHAMFSSSSSRHVKKDQQDCSNSSAYQQPMQYPVQAQDGAVYYSNPYQQGGYYPAQTQGGAVYYSNPYPQDGYYPAQDQGTTYYSNPYQQGGYYPEQYQQGGYYQEQGQQGGYYHGQAPNGMAYYPAQDQGGYYPEQGQNPSKGSMVNKNTINKSIEKQKKAKKKVVKDQVPTSVSALEKNEDQAEVKSDKPAVKPWASIVGTNSVEEKVVVKDQVPTSVSALEKNEAEVNPDKPVVKSWASIVGTKSVEEKAVNPVIKSKFKPFYYTDIGSIKNKVFEYLDRAKLSIRVQVDQLRPSFADKLASIKIKDSSINISVLTNIYDPCSNMCKNYEINEKCDVCKTSHDFKKAVQILIEHGVNVMFHSDNAIHDKFIVVDNCLTLIGSCNYTYAGLNFNRESGVIINDEAVANCYTDYWFVCRYMNECNYANAVVESSKFKSLVLKTKKCPLNEKSRLSNLEKMNTVSDDIRENGMDICFSFNHNISDFVCNAIANAKSSIKIQVFNFTSGLIAKAIYDALIENKGLQVTIRTGCSFDTIKNAIRALERENMQPCGLDSNWRKKQEQPQSCITRINFEEVADPYSDDGRAWCVHDKLIVIDAETVLLGSANFTQGTDDGAMLENMIQIKDAKLAEEMLNYMSDQ